MFRAILTALIVCLAATADAQFWLGSNSNDAGSTACVRDNTWTFEPAQVDTATYLFEGRTLAASPTPVVTVAVINEAQDDASPSAMVTAGPSVSGSSVTIQLTPDQGCGTAGCRAGNWYQVKVQPTDTLGNKPTHSACVWIKPVLLAPQ